MRDKTMIEVVSYEQSQSWHLPLFEFCLAGMLAVMAFTSNQSMVSILAAILFSMFYIFRHNRQSLWMLVKAILLGVTLFSVIQIMIGINTYNRSGQWANPDLEVGRKALEMITAFSLLFYLIKNLIKKPSS